MEGGTQGCLEGRVGRWHCLKMYSFPGRFQGCWVNCSPVFSGGVKKWGGA